MLDRAWRGPGLVRASTTGIALAVAAYVAWGFLSPVGQILVESMGPFTANAIRTLGSLPLLFVLLGPRASARAVRALPYDGQGWILGGVWLTVTFVPYLWSLKYLPPTITTLTIYLTPLLVAAWLRLRHGTRPNPMLLPAVVATLAGGWLAIAAPGGVPRDAWGALGLTLAIVGVMGWAAYTLHLKHLTATRNPDELTLVAFLTSAVAFCAGALVVERVRVDWTPELGGWLALYILVPSVASFYLYSRSLRHVEATTIAVLLGIELVATALVSYWIRDETFSPTKVAGLVLVVGAVTAYMWVENRRASRNPGGPGT